MHFQEDWLLHVSVHMSYSSGVGGYSEMNVNICVSHFKRLSIARAQQAGSLFSQLLITNFGRKPLLALGN